MTQGISQLQMDQEFAAITAERAAGLQAAIDNGSIPPDVQTSTAAPTGLASFRRPLPPAPPLVIVPPATVDAGDIDDDPTSHGGLIGDAALEPPGPGSDIGPAGGAWAPAIPNGLRRPAPPPRLVARPIPAPVPEPAPVVADHGPTAGEGYVVPGAAEARAATVPVPPATPVTPYIPGSAGYAQTMSAADVSVGPNGEYTFAPQELHPFKGETSVKPWVRPGSEVSAAGTTEKAETKTGSSGARKGTKADQQREAEAAAEEKRLRALAKPTMSLDDATLSSVDGTPGETTGSIDTTNLTPEQRLSIRQHDEGELAQNKGLAEIKTINTDAEATGRLAKTQRQQADDIDDTLLARNKRDKEQIDADEANSLAMKNFQLDPNRYMHNASFLQKAIMLIGGAAGGISAGIKGGPNSYLDFLNKMIDRDIDQQKSQYEQMKQRGVDIHNQWSMNVRKDQNDDEQKAIMRAQAQQAVVNEGLKQVRLAGGEEKHPEMAQVINKLGEAADLGDAQRAAAAKAALGKGEAQETQAHFDERAQKTYDHAISLGYTPQQAQQIKEGLSFRGKSVSMTGLPAKPGKQGAAPLDVPDLSHASTAGSIGGKLASWVGLESWAPATADNLQSQKDHNLAVDETVRKVFGTRGQAAEKMANNLRVSSGMDQAAIDRRSAAFKRFVADHDPNARAVEDAQARAGFSEH